MDEGLQLVKLGRVSLRLLVDLVQCRDTNVVLLELILQLGNLDVCLARAAKAIQPLLDSGLELRHLTGQGRLHGDL